MLYSQTQQKPQQIQAYNCGAGGNGTAPFRPQPFSMVQSDAQGNPRRLESGSDLLLKSAEQQQQSANMQQKAAAVGTSSNDTKNNNMNNPLKDSNSFMQLSSLNNSEVKQLNNPNGNNSCQHQ